MCVTIHTDITAKIKLWSRMFLRILHPVDWDVDGHFTRFKFRFVVKENVEGQGRVICFMIKLTKM